MFLCDKYFFLILTKKVGIQLKLLYYNAIMKLTNKGRYAVMAMADLASNAKDGPISLSEISLRQIFL